MKLIWSFLLLSFPLSSFAQTQSATCADKVERRGSIQLQQIASGDNKNCYLSIHNFKEGGLLYRDYSFTSDGDFMVFNSFGEGPDSDFTGAREFYVFPRSAPMATYEWNDDAHRLEVTDVSGGKFYFDYEDAQINGMTKGTVKVASEVVDTNKGGVEISNYKGLILDVGFTKGQAPSQVATATVTFTDENAVVCKVKNKEVFKPLPDNDVEFRYSDKELAAFLKTKCPKLKFPAN